jgi:hypothetical protein
MAAVRAIAIWIDIGHLASLLGNKKHPQTIKICERWIGLRGALERRAR